MLRFCLALLAGAYALHACASLPRTGWLLPGFAVALTGLALPRLRLVAALLLGFCISWHASQSVIADRLPEDMAGITLILEGRVADFPELRGAALRFIVEVHGAPELPRRVRLSWYEADSAPRIGESWRLSVRLRRPRGFSNPVGFDYEQWLFRQGIGATGYVVASESNRRLEARAVPFLAKIRRQLAERIVRVCGSNDAAAVLQAIVVGARHGITQAQWDRYAASGTSHLMAISGLHIGLAGGGAFVLAWLLIAPMCRWGDVRDRAAVAAVLAAGLYAGLSGFAVPAERALLMAVAVLLAGVARRPAPAERVLALVAMAVFAGDPLSILAPGFMLSFTAVAILVWSGRQRYFSRVGGHGPVGGRLRELVCRLPPLQLVLLFGLMPLTAVLFGRVAWLAPLVNLAVLPLFNLVTVPSALLGALFDGPLHSFGDALLKLAWHCIRATLWIIGKAADWQAARGQVAAAATLVLPAALLTAACALLPPAWPGRKLAWLAALAVATARPAAVPRHCIDVTVLDVGQGLAVAMRTARRTLVFDTGPAFRSGGDTGQLVLVPWLRRHGIDQVDLLLVSHADSDHAGGVRSLASAIDVRQVLAGELIPNVAAAPLRCRRGQAWLWDGVRFAIMHPGRSPVSSGNDRSCVLEVAVGRHRILLTGDIESPVENRLLESASLRPADLVVVPHHGSRTSSGAQFVAKLRPRVAIVSAGFDNRWGLPKEDVVKRWAETGARVLNTATSGAISFRLCAQGGLGKVGEQRIDARRHWQAMPGK